MYAAVLSLFTEKRDTNVKCYALGILRLIKFQTHHIKTDTALEIKLPLKLLLNVARILLPGNSNKVKSFGKSHTYGKLNNALHCVIAT